MSGRADRAVPTAGAGARRAQTAGARRRPLGVSLASTLCGVLASLTAAASDEAMLRIGWTAWSDAEFITRLTERVVEEAFGLTVELVLVDIALQYQGVARGDLDAMLMAWLPNTHADYYERFGDQVDDLGPVYTGGRLGWVVPAYVPASALATIEDLARPEVARRLNREIFGIDPGAGLTRLSEQALRDYGLERYHLITSSAAAMTAMVERAARRERWIVATAWRPHWMFEAWDLRFLADPRGSLGGVESAHALVRRGLREDLPQVVAFLTRMDIPLAELEAALAVAHHAGHGAAVQGYLAEHAARVRWWVTGEGEAPPTGP